MGQGLEKAFCSSDKPSRQFPHNVTLIFFRLWPPCLALFDSLLQEGRLSGGAFSDHLTHVPAPHFSRSVPCSVRLCHGYCAMSACLYIHLFFFSFTDINTCQGLCVLPYSTKQGFGKKQGYRVYWKHYLSACWAGGRRVVTWKYVASEQPGVPFPCTVCCRSSSRDASGGPGWGLCAAVPCWRSTLGVPKAATWFCLRQGNGRHSNQLHGSRPQSHRFITGNSAAKPSKGTRGCKAEFCRQVSALHSRKAKLHSCVWNTVLNTQLPFPKKWFFRDFPVSGKPNLSRRLEKQGLPRRG